MKHMKEYPTQESLKEIFDYNDGYLIRKISKTNPNVVGKRTGFYSSKGYLECKVGREKYSIHRLVWIWHNGDIPKDMLINHINEIKDDNRIENLEIVSNRKNVAISRKPISGFTGVRPNGYDRITKLQKWQATITNPKRNGRTYLGTYSTKEEAARAYDMKAIEFEGMSAKTNFPIEDYLYCDILPDPQD